MLKINLLVLLGHLKNAGYNDKPKKHVVILPLFNKTFHAYFTTCLGNN